MQKLQRHMIVPLFKIQTRTTVAILPTATTPTGITRGLHRNAQELAAKQPNRSLNLLPMLQRLQPLLLPVLLHPLLRHQLLLPSLALLPPLRAKTKAGTADTGRQMANAPRTPLICWPTARNPAAPVARPLPLPRRYRLLFHSVLLRLVVIVVPLPVPLVLIGPPLENAPEIPLICKRTAGWPAVHSKTGAKFEVFN